MHDYPELQAVMRATFPQDQYDQFAELREKARAGTITANEHQVLARLQHDADLLPLRKAYAAVLLKWRGHRIPSLATLEATS